MQDCSNPACDHDFSYDAGFEDPPSGEGHIQVSFNPAEEPSFVVQESRYYCSTDCMLVDSEDHPFSGGEE